MHLKFFFRKHVLYIWADSPASHIVLFCFYDSATSLSKNLLFFWRKLFKFGQVWLDLCKIMIKFGKF